MIRDKNRNGILARLSELNLIDREYKKKVTYELTEDGNNTYQRKRRISMPNTRRMTTTMRNKQLFKFKKTAIGILMLFKKIFRIPGEPGKIKKATIFSSY